MAVRKYVNVSSLFERPAKSFADILTNGGLEVRRHPQTFKLKDFKNVVVGQIIEKNKHPNADSLTLCSVSHGSE